jgi:ferredoxin-fold anticodon binding domain-containing protein
LKTNKEILDNFGKIIISEVFDNQFRFILNKTEDLSKTDGYKNLFNNMSLIQKKEIEHYTKEILVGALFDILRVFEENEDFKLIYEKDGKQINLVEISEMLKAELIIENGWIERFSKEIK